MAKDYYNLHLGLVLKYFWQVIRRYKLSFFVVIICTIIPAVLDIYIPLQFLELWNILDTNNFDLAPQAIDVVYWIFFLFIIRWAIRRIGSFTTVYFQSEVIAQLREQAYSKLIDHSYSFFINNFAGSLTQKVNKYARAFEKLADRLTFDGLPLFIRGAGTIIAIYTLLPVRYTIILSAFIAIFLITTFIFTKLKLKYDINSALADSRTTGAIVDSISNHSSMQIFTGHEFEREHVGKVIDEQKKATATNWYLWEVLHAIQALYTSVVMVVLIYFAVLDWKIGLIALPVIVLLEAYMVRLIENLWSFGRILKVFYEGFSDAQEIALILDTPYEIQETSKEKLEKVKGEIVFDRASYTYKNNDTSVIENFNLSIPRGQKVALVGSSGAGKTTFIRLLMRFFDLSKGRITIDGVDISQISQDNLRRQIAFVPQDPVLFHRTLLENIRYGRRDATDEEVKVAASLAHCDEFIDGLPLGYDTFVGERGVKLSGGERQRVAIARAILKNAPILILDEATSSLDSQSEAYIQDALEKLMKDKTTIVIAHRLSTIKKMDRIIVLEEGTIAEDGTHQELLNKDSGIYRKLWELQAGGFGNMV